MYTSTMLLAGDLTCIFVLSIHLVLLCHWLSVLGAHHFAQLGIAITRQT
jgi:hypothetical protein